MDAVDGVVLPLRAYQIYAMKNVSSVEWRLPRAHRLIHFAVNTLFDVAPQRLLYKGSNRHNTFTS